MTPKQQGDVETVRAAIEGTAQVDIAIGYSRASIHGAVVDGPALDVEAWAPYPLPGGMWVATPTP